jgi:hypothetical protein
MVARSTCSLEARVGARAPGAGSGSDARRSRKRTSAAAALIATSLLCACSPGEAAPGADATLEAVRAATEKYQDVRVALADGYVRDPMDICETPYHMGRTGQDGVMGIHFLRRDLLGIDEDETRLDVTGTHTDFRQPAVLLYEPRPDGSLELLALENLVAADAWTAAGHASPPSFQGESFQHMAENPGMGVRAHYDLHVWLYRENPSGVFAQYNPNATCQHHVYHMPMMSPMDSMHPMP